MSRPAPRISIEMTDVRVQEGGARLGEEVVWMTDVRVQEGGARLGKEVV